VFDGIGYIASTIWVDKGVKALIPYGRNDDGTLKNIEVVTDRVLVGKDYNTENSNIECRLVCGTSGNLSLSRNIVSTGFGYDEEKNIYYRPDGLIPNSVCIAKVAASTKGIETFEAMRPFHAVDYNDLVGEWYKKSLTVASNVSCAVGTTTFTYDLSSYLPNDGNKYEVYVYCTVESGTAVNSRCAAQYGNSEYMCALSYSATSVANNTPGGGNTGIVVINNDRVLKFSVTSTNSNGKLSTVICNAYRKVR
jgi:hypothetical protein